MRVVKRNRGATNLPLIQRNAGAMPMEQQQRTSVLNSRDSSNIGLRQSGYPVVTGNTQKQIQDFNIMNAEYTQSYRVTLNQGANPFTPVLSGSGLFFHGISLSIGTITSLQDTQVNFTINNRQLLVDVSALILIPNYAQGMLFYPTPQPLTGKDTFKINFQKNDAGTITAFFNFMYKPSL